MNKFTLYLKTGENRIKLEENIQTQSDSKMIVKNASIFWDCINVITNVNDVIEHSETITFGQDYWTFDMIRTFLLRFGIVLVANEYNNGCSIQSQGHDLNLKKFGLLLGFPENYIVTANSWITSPKNVEINDFLRFVTIDCNLVDRTRNFDTTGKRSTVITTLPISTQQKLNGSVTHFSDRQCVVPLYNGTFGELVFSVNVNVVHKAIMTVLLEIEINK